MFSNADHLSPGMVLETSDSEVPELKEGMVITLSTFRAARDTRLHVSVWGMPYSEQVIINLDEMLKTELNRIGEQIKASGQPASVEINGVKAEFYPSGWKDVEGVHGYSKPEGLTRPMPRIRENCMTMNCAVR